MMQFKNVEPMGRGWKSERKSRGFRCTNCAHKISKREMHRLKKDSLPCPKCGNDSRFRKC